MRDPFTAFTNTNGVAFPNTEAKNASGPSTTDGTEFVKIGIDDGMDWGAAQALLDAAGLTPNGLIESVTNSQKLQAMEILFGIPRNYISGMILSNAADADHDITISIGEARSALASSRARIALASAITKQIDVNWVAGNNAGGFPSTLTLAADTWYPVFGIKNPTTKVVDGGFDTSLVATNLLADAAGYTEFKRVGSVLTDGSLNIIAFTAREIGGGALEFLWDSAVAQFSDSNPGIARVTKTMDVPTGFPVTALASYSLVDDSAAAPTFAVVLSPDQTDVAPSATIYDLGTPGTGGATRDASYLPRRTNASGQITYRLSVSTVDHDVVGTTHGWIDGRI